MKDCFCLDQTFIYFTGNSDGVRWEAYITESSSDVSELLWALQGQRSSFRTKTFRHFLWRGLTSPQSTSNMSPASVWKQGESRKPTREFKSCSECVSVCLSVSVSVCFCVCVTSLSSWVQSKILNLMKSGPKKFTFSSCERFFSFIRNYLTKYNCYIFLVHFKPH